MLLPSKITIEIKTASTSFTAPINRVYQLTVHDKSETTALVSLSKFDKTPTGYIRGGSQVKFIEYEEIAIPDTTAKQWLADLASKHDVSLRASTVCELRNDALGIIARQLIEIGTK